jgi:hypothetical protein
MRLSWMIALALIPSGAGAALPGAAEACGEVVTLETHGRTTTRYTFNLPRNSPAAGEPIALVLLVGGGRHLNPRRQRMSARAARQFARALAAAFP